jgi:formylmethanofuran dehydrogenase subunit E
MPDDELLAWQRVHVQIGLPATCEKHSVVCHRCKCKVHEHAEVMMQGQVLCAHCSGKTYFETV